jgi:hypothetical protein
MKLMDLAHEVERAADDIQVIRRQGNKVLIRVFNGCGGRLYLVGRKWLETYLDEIGAAERAAQARSRKRNQNRS